LDIYWCNFFLDMCYLIDLLLHYLFDNTLLNVCVNKIIQIVYINQIHFILSNRLYLLSY